VLLLSRVRHHMGDVLTALPNITCRETVLREYGASKNKLKRLDTVELEIQTDGRRELFAAPGGRKFTDRPPISYAGSGVLGDGLLVANLWNVVVSGNGSYEFKGQEQVQGRQLARWDYSLPVMWAGLRIDLVEGSGNVGLRGSFWADPDTYDVVRLDLIATEIPSSLPIRDAETTISYRPVDLGTGAAALLPTSGDFQMVRLSGAISRNHTTLNDCRKFQAESKLRFGDPEPAQADFSTAVVDDTLRDLPAGLSIDVKLRSSISSRMAVGSRVMGEVARDVNVNSSLRISKGAIVRGRLRRMERYTSPYAYDVVALAFTEIESEGVLYRFSADLTDMGSLPGMERSLTVEAQVKERGPSTVMARESINLPVQQGMAAFFVKGREMSVPPGFRTSWKTR
jgi:hypothetical protein